MEGAAPADPQQEEQHEVIAHDKATGVVVFGAFVAGSLVGIIIAAPAFIVVLLGAGTAALCFEDGQLADFARKVGKGASGILLAIEKKGRQLNKKYKPSKKFKAAAHRVSKRVTEADKKHGLTQKIKAKATSVRKSVDKGTGGKRQKSQGPIEIVHITDGTDGGAAGG